MSWEDYLIGSAVNAIITVARDPKGRSKWRKALLKIFAEIARAFRDDADFAAAVSEGKP